MDRSATRAARGEPRDRLAIEYLDEPRTATLWYELLAEAATGRLDLAALRAAATTGPRQAELAFYGVVLGLDPAAQTPAGHAASCSSRSSRRTS